MKDNGDRMPEGHVNAYSKARDAFNKANGIKPRAAAKPKARPDRKRVNALVTEEPEESDFSSNDSEASFRTAMKTVRTRVCGVLPQPTPVANTFQALDDQCDDIVDCLPALNGWAHRVVVKPRKVVKRPKTTDVVITCEDDLDAALREDELLSAKLPGTTDRTKLMAMMSKCPPADQLQPGEVWALVDSGSGVDGADLSSICPGLHIDESPNKIVCETANGEEMIASKVAYVRVALDGQECNIPMSDLPLKMPIISVRQHVGPRKHSCRIQQGGGYFRNLATRAKSRFVEREGVYFIRLKVLSNVPRENCQLFGRQGIAR